MPNEVKTNRSGARSGESDGIDRRRLLTATVSAAGMAGVAIPLGSLAQTATTYSAPKKRIDAHTHFSFLKFLDMLEKQEGKPFVLAGQYKAKPSLTDPKARLDLLDRNEIDVHVLVPVPWLEAFPRVVADRTLAAQALAS